MFGGEFFGGARFGDAPQYITGSGISSTEAFGSGKLNLVLKGTGIASTEGFGVGTVKTVTVLHGTGIASSEAFGSDQLNLRIFDSSIGSAETFGSGQLKLRLIGSGIASGEAFGSDQLNLRIFDTGIPSSEAFGASKLALRLLGSGISSQEQFGNSNLNLIIIGTGIPTGTAFGSTSLLRTLTYINLGTNEPLLGGALFGGDDLSIPAQRNIPSAEEFGHGLVRYISVLIGTGIAGSEAFGSDRLNLRIFDMSIPSLETFGTQFIYKVPNSIPTGDIARFTEPIGIISNPHARGVVYVVPSIIGNTSDLEIVGSITPGSRLVGAVSPNKLIGILSATGIIGHITKGSPNGAISRPSRFTISMNRAMAQIGEILEDSDELVGTVRDYG